MTKATDTMPMPPRHLTEALHPTFEPAAGLASWAVNTFVARNGALANPDHEHLREAEIAFLWTNVEYVKKGKRVLGEARLGEPSKSHAWSHGRQVQQLREWFGRVPDFLVTLDATFVARRLAESDAAAVCALIEHELYHCAQKMDRYGMPSFNKQTGKPNWTIAPHDVEEFVGVVRRYGADAARVRELVDAANRGPEIGRADVDGVCGRCLRKVA